MHNSFFIMIIVAALGCTASHEPADVVVPPGAVSGYESSAHRHLFVDANGSCVIVLVALGAPVVTAGELRIESDVGSMAVPEWDARSCATVRTEERPADDGTRALAESGWLRYVDGQISGELAFPDRSVRIEEQHVTLL